MATNTSFHDYSEAIVVPEKIPAHLKSHFTALREAKKVINILSAYTQGAKLYKYTIQNGAPGDLILPEQYNFDGFHIRFLPGWLTYSVVLDDGINIPIRTPHGREEFEEDLVIIRKFVKAYKALPDTRPQCKEIVISSRYSIYESYVRSRPPLSKRQEAVIAFNNELRRQGLGFHAASN